MTKTPQKRDNSYYLQRLRIDHPSIFADYQDGKYSNAAAAFAAAGLRKSRTPLDLLKSAWKTASDAERDTFKAMIGCVAASTPSPSSVSKKPLPSVHPGPISAPTQAVAPVHVDGYLSPDVVTHIGAVMSRREMKMGDVMAELGFKKLNPSLGLAMNQGSRVKDRLLLDALENWLKKNSLHR